MVTTAQLASRPRYSVTEACRLAAVNPSTLWRWASSGLRGVTLPLHQLGGRKFVFADEFDQFIQATTKPTNTPPCKSSADAKRDAEIAAAEADADARGL
jgi:hypothetical protein